MELVVDAGNTKVKIALFINNGIHKIWKAERTDDTFLDEIREFPIENAILSSTRHKEEIHPELFGLAPNTLWLSHETPLPFSNMYETPKTLGKDRLAGIAGGRFLYPNRPILVVDAGTCITYDVLNERDEYLGGNISPGIHLRLNSLNAFTDGLPLVELEDIDSLIGTNTNTAILTGVLNGYRGEVNSIINSYKKKFPSLQTILCGGDAKYLVNHMENKIFASQNLVLLGLHKILRHNL